MKKILCLLTALLLALSCVGAMASGDVVLEADESIFASFNTIFTLGDAVYFDSDKCVYEWRDGDEKPTPYAYEEEEDAIADRTFVFAVGESLYGIRLYTETEDDYTELTGAVLCDVTLDGGKCAFEERCDLDWSELVSESDTGVQLFPMRNIIDVNGIAYMLYFDWGDGDMVPRVAALDIEAESVEVLDGLENAFQIAAYKDGKLLALQIEDDEYTVAAYDPEEDEAEELCELEKEGRGDFAGLAYDPDKDAAYITLSGKVHTIDLESGELSDPVADVPLQYLSFYNQATVLQDGRYAILSSSAAILNVSGNYNDVRHLNVCDTRYCFAIDQAIDALNKAGNDLRVNVTRDNTVLDNIVENLVNQDGSVDIYVLDTTQPVYDALVRRGYMMSLDDSEKIKALADRMYPAARESMYADGHIVALPVEVRSAVMGFNEPTLNKLGLTLDDVPTNWDELLDFLPSLQETMEENDVRLTFSMFPVDQVRRSFFNQLFNDYQNYMNLTDVEMGYDTDMLRSLLKKLEAVDFLALGCAEDEDDVREEDYDAFFGSQTATLLMYPDMDATFNNFTGTAFTPTLLGMDAETPGNLVIKTTVAFINPYCENPEAAKEFMDIMADKLSNATLYTLIPDLNEAVRGETNQQILDELNEEMDELRKQIEKAEGSKRKMLEDDLASRQESYDMLDTSMWDIHQEALDWYRPHAESMTIATTEWLDDESQSMIEQYLAGDVSAEEMLEAIERKVKMMRMEGN